MRLSGSSRLISLRKFTFIQARSIFLMKFGRSWSLCSTKSMKAKLCKWRKSWSPLICIPLKWLRTIWHVLRNCSWNWANVGRIIRRQMDNSSSWSWWIWEHPSTCSVPCFRPIGKHTKNMVRIIPLIFYVDYWLMINIGWLMKWSLVVNINLAYSRERERWIINKGDGLILLYIDHNALTRKLKGILMNRHLVGRIERRKTC